MSPVALAGLSELDTFGLLAHHRGEFVRYLDCSTLPEGSLERLAPQTDWLWLERRLIVVHPDLWHDGRWIEK